MDHAGLYRSDEARQQMIARLNERAVLKGLIGVGVTVAVALGAVLLVGGIGGERLRQAMDRIGFRAVVLGVASLGLVGGGVVSAVTVIGQRKLRKALKGPSSLPYTVEQRSLIREEFPVWRSVHTRWTLD